MNFYDEPTMSAPQADATVIMGPVQAGYQQFLQYWASGELATHNRSGRIALWTSLVLNIFYTAVTFHECYVSGVVQDRTSYTLQNGDLSWNILPLLAGIIAALTEGFLAVGAGNLVSNRRLRIAFWIWIGVLATIVLFGSAVVCATGVLYYNGAETVFIEWSVGIAIFLWASAVADLSISAACAWGLRSRIAGFNEVTDSLLRKLILIVVRTASYTSLLSVIGAIVNGIYSDDDLNTYIGSAFWMPMAGLYGLSLFTFSAGSRRAINSRVGGNSNGFTPGAPPIAKSTLSAGHMSGGQLPIHGVQYNGPASSPLQISVQHSSTVEYDEPTGLEVDLMEERKKRAARDFGV